MKQAKSEPIDEQVAWDLALDSYGNFWQEGAKYVFKVLVSEDWLCEELSHSLLNYGSRREK